MTLDTAWRLAAGFLLVGLNAFFVAVEFALTRLPNLDLSERELEDSPGLRRAVKMLDRLEIHLTGCQLGISATSLLLGVIAEPAVTRLLEPVASWVGLSGGTQHATSVVVAVVAMNLVHKIWGEQAPTYLGVERPRGVARRLAPILYWWSRVMKPIIYLGDGAAKWTLRIFGVRITRSWAAEEAEGGGTGGEAREAGTPPGDRAELRRRMAALLGGGDIPPDREEEVLASLEIDEIPARDIMNPVDEMVTLALDASAEENLSRIAGSGHVRYPVLARGRSGNGGPRTLEEVAGVVYVPALFHPPERLRGDDLGLEEILEEPVALDADIPVARLIDRLQHARQEVALLVADGNRIVGMATITDALETIAGEVEDPLDSEEDAS